MQTKKLLISFLLAITFGMITCGTIFYILKERLLTANINTKVQEVDSELRKEFQNQESLLNALVETVGNTSEIASALQAQDKDALYQKYRTLFTHLKKTHGVTHFSFHLPDRKNLIRLHLPRISGDVIERQSLIKAATTGQITRGLEQGQTGNITLRVVKPIIQDKKIFGFLELGTDISYLLNEVRQHLTLNYAVLIDKSFLNSNQWRGQIGRSQGQTEWDTLENFVVVGSSDNATLRNLLPKIQEAVRPEASDFLEITDDTFWKNYPLLNLEGQPMGFVLIHGPISEVQNNLSPLFTVFGAIFLAVTGLMSYMSWKICTNFLKSNKAAKHSAHMSSVGEMASGITHEIANPVAIISLCVARVKTLIETNSQDRQKIYDILDRIERMTSRISKINTSMRLASRSGHKDPAAPISTKALILDTLELCHDKFYSENVELRIKEIPDHIVYCRSYQISQVLFNLLNNARDAVSELKIKWVELGVEVKSDSLKISVTDSGNGIPKKIAAQMMSPFFTTKGLHKGTGLGLSISKEIIQEHHGKLYYDDTSPNTRFIIELPIADSSAAHI